MSSNPFGEDDYSDADEATLLSRARGGDRKALEELVKAHQAWIFNIALRMVYDHDEAADVTQEILLKIVTRLSTFEGRSGVRTWLYRIVVNHVLDKKRGKIENMVTTFTDYGKTLEEIENSSQPSPQSAPADLRLIVEEAKIGCMTGMLLCLDREQRLVFILGELFGVGDRIGAELLEVSRDNFRKKLSRARRDLYNFMNEKCGLVNRSNPCRCARKTRGFIQLGVVDPENLRWAKDHHQTIREQAPAALQHYEGVLEPRYTTLFRDHPYQEPPDFAELLKSLLRSEESPDPFELQ